MDKIELHPAYAWDCEECGRENFCRAIVLDILEEEKEAINEQYGEAFADDFVGSGIWVSKPDNVTCVHCGATFETTEIMSDEDDEDID